MARSLPNFYDLSAEMSDFKFHVQMLAQIYSDI